MVASRPATPTPSHPPRDDAPGGHEPAAAAHGPAPLSSAQRRSWFLHRLAPDSSAYHLSVGARLTGPLDLEALTAALRDVVDRHETLRTVYPADAAGGPTQVVLDRPAAELFTVTFQDLTARPAAAVRAAMAAFGREPIDLGGQIPLRALVARVGPDEHVLYLVLAHIAADDPSLAILFADLAACYRARCQGGRPEPGAPSARYADHARREGTAEQLTEVTRHLSWWRDALSPPPPLLAAALAGARDDREPAPARHPDLADADRPALRREVTLTAEVTRRLRALAVAHQTSLADVLLAAGMVLLHRSTGETDIAVGTSVTDRPHTGLEGVVGNFANTVVLRARVDARRTFGALVEAVRERSFAARARREAPFDEVVRALRDDQGRCAASARPEGSPGRPLGPGLVGGTGGGLFDVAFSHRSRLLPDVALPGLSVEELGLENGAARFPLVLTAQDDPDAVTVAVAVDATVFTAAAADRLVGRFARLCEQADEHVVVGELDALSAAERRLVVDDWPSGPVSPLVERSLTGLVADQAQRAPDALAVVGLDGDGGPAVTLSYGELERRAEEVAARLRAAGVGPEVTVGVCVPRSAALVVALLGVLRAGGAFVPLEASWPARRVVAVAGGAGIAAVVTGAGVALPELPTAGPPGVPSTGTVPVIRLDPAGRPAGVHDGVEATATDLSADPGLVEDPSGGVDLENLAYVIYTSGSTGTPKGVMIRHQAICNRLRWQADLLGLTAGDVLLHKAPLGVDISVNEIFLPLTAGARLVVAPPRAESDPDALLEIIREHSVTFCYVGTSLLDAMLGRPDAAVAGLSLRYVWCGGEVLPDELYRRFRDRWDARMFHGYGPAEATIGVSCRVFEPGGAAPRVSIGRPNPNTQIRILDDEYNPVPVGAVGELFISGLPLARGYLNDPRRTADRFMPDPFSPVPGSRMYATGDLARFRPDGEIEFLGRADNQVKIRGFRVEPEEIEHALARHPGVRQAVVVLATARAGTDELRAYYLAEGDAAPPTAAQLRAWLSERLPRHLVPDVFVPVGELPRTAAGKTDRRALAALGSPAPDPSGAEHLAPAAGLEQLVADVWSQVLGVERVGADDDFFGLGGHSLLLIRVQTQLEARLGRRVALPDLCAHTTVERLARRLDAVRADADGPGRDA
ncbi:non-ribosomal peptide synthetase [Pseudofrankia sp. DC12]|uniref:non-ribosomal peptide synthetase n=1 Tax=Pseudofrankia sp. DC12 TaxID=683315 RepID=UPI0006975B02|nr:non-ribosomal peptide synthetase [Pseudofrankia sp. DC12]